MSSNMPDPVLNEYFAECEELSERVSKNLQLIEKGQAPVDVIDSMYRDIHTIKGSSQLFGFKEIGDLTHSVETCLDPVRKNKLELNALQLDLFLRCLDVVNEMLTANKAGQSVDFTVRLFQLNEELTLATPSSEEHAPTAVAQVVAAAIEETPTETALEMLAHSSAPTPTPQTVPANNAQASQAVAQATNAGSAETSESSSIRVPVSLLDKLMTLMGEMVLVRNQVLQYANQTENLEFLNLSQRLDVVTSEIQGEVMKTRMQPIGVVLTKFQRVVRDLARDLGKRIELSLSGTETELDKTLLEAVKDPLMHIVRNSCDHGIEGIEDRKAAGKSESGTISIRSFHEGGQVIVEISDDGKGLHREKLIKKAIEKNLIAPEKAALLSDSEVYALIFAPGFSTAAAVTNVSGRGVGMDVVKSNIEGIGGHVEILSQEGRGTTTRLKIPLTLAIVPAMIVRHFDERFAIPQVKLVELVRVEKSNPQTKIEYLQGKPVYRLRGNLLPLVTLAGVLSMENSRFDADQDVFNIVVLNAEGRLFGLIVDEVQDTAEVVVKPMSSFLKNLAVYSGATVLGDGTVALILDVVGIARKEQLLTETTAKANQFKGEENAGVSQELQEFLLFRMNSQTKYAMPLNLVHRLEEFQAKSIEYSGAQRVVRYRNSVLPILSLSQILNLPETGPKPPVEDAIPVIVSQKSGRFYGIEVSEILDVLSTAQSLNDHLADRPGLLGNLLAEEEIVVVIDVLTILDEAAKKLNVVAAGKPAPKKSLQGIKILFAEDTIFFKKMVCQTLEREGAIVTAVEHGKDAMAILEKSNANDFDVILSDIEMPKMNGLEFAKAVRQTQLFKSVPMIALTTRYTQTYIEEGLKAGFDAYLEKLKPEILLAEINSRLKNKPQNQRSAS